MIRHHLADDLVVGHAAGALADGWSLVVVAHLTLCPLCRGRYAIAESVGGILLEELGSNLPLRQSWAKVRMRLVQPSPNRPEHAGDDLAVAPDCLPLPVRSHGNLDVGSLKWRGFGRGAYQIPIRTADDETRARFLRIPAGKSVPEHSHRGRELTLVLSGTLWDGERRFRRGDILDMDEALTHKPVAGADGDCVCLVVTDAPLRFHGWIMRLVQPYLGI